MKKLLLFYSTIFLYGCSSGVSDKLRENTTYQNITYAILNDNQSEIDSVLNLNVLFGGKVEEFQLDSSIAIGGINKIKSR